MKCRFCNSDLVINHENYIANQLFELKMECSNENCSYLYEENCGATREFYKGKELKGD